MNTPTLPHPLTHLPDNAAGRIGEVVTASRDLAHDLASTVAERAPDLTSAVGRGARSSVDAVSDVVAELPGQVTKMATKLAALAPFVDTPPPARRWSRWPVRLALLAAVAGIGWWLVQRRADDSAADVDASRRQQGASAQPLASAGD